MNNKAKKDSNSWFHIHTNRTILASWLAWFFRPMQTMQKCIRSMIQNAVIYFSCPLLVKKAMTNNSQDLLLEFSENWVFSWLCFFINDSCKYFWNVLLVIARLDSSSLVVLFKVFLELVIYMKLTARNILTPQTSNNSKILVCANGPSCHGFGPSLLQNISEKWKNLWDL